MLAGHPGLAALLSGIMMVVTWDPEPYQNGETVVMVYGYIAREAAGDSLGIIARDLGGLRVEAAAGRADVNVPIPILPDLPCSADGEPTGCPQRAVAYVRDLPAEAGACPGQAWGDRVDGAAERSEGDRAKASPLAQ